MLQKTLIFFLLLIANLATLYGQVSISEMKTSGEAFRFVKREVEKTLNERALKNTDASESDSLISWIAEDFNNDNIKDLAFSGKLYHRFYNLVFLSSDTGYFKTSLEDTWDEKLILSSYRKNDSTFLIIGKSKWKYENGLSQKLFKTDTVTTFFNGFIEYNGRNNSPLDFDSVVYKVISNWVASSSSITTIYRSGKAETKLFFFDQQEKIKTYSATSIRQLQELLGYMNFFEMDKYYGYEGITDLTRAFVTIYKNGKSFQVEDYGMHGTYGLALFYSGRWSAIYNRPNEY